MLGAALFFSVIVGAAIARGFIAAALGSSMRFLLWKQRRQAALVRRHELLLLEQEARFARERAALAEALDLPDGTVSVPALRKPDLDALQRDHARWLLDHEQNQERDLQGVARRRMLG